MLMRDDVERKLMLYAAGRAIGCQACGATLDGRTAVLCYLSDARHGIGESDLHARIFCAAPACRKAVWSAVESGFWHVIAHHYPAAPAPAPRKPRTAGPSRIACMRALLVACGWREVNSRSGRYDAWQRPGSVVTYFLGNSAVRRSNDGRVTRAFNAEATADKAQRLAAALQAWRGPVALAWGVR